MIEQMQRKISGGGTIFRRRWIAGAAALLLGAPACGGSGDAAGSGATPGPGAPGATAGVGQGGDGTVPGAGAAGSAGVSQGQGGQVGGMPIDTTYDVGVAPMTRLNRVQYNNTVADLL